MLVVVLCSSVQAMKIDSNSVAAITTDPCHQVNGYSGGFGVSGNVAAWTDQRDPLGVGRVYGVNLDDPCHQEFLVDANASNTYQLAISGPVIVYTVQRLDGSQFVRVEDITNQSSPRIIAEFSPLVEYVYYLDVSGNVVAYCDWETVCMADISDANNIRQYIISVLPSGDYASGLAIDANRIIWSANSSEPNGYVRVADITDANNPNIATAFLPENTAFGSIDASGEWLAAAGLSNWRYRIFAVHNYSDVNNWKIETLWKEGEGGDYYVSGPRIDGPVTVWVTNTGVPTADEPTGPSPQQPEYFLKAGYLMGNGGFSVSTLLQDLFEIDAADISNSQVVWSQMHDVIDLYKGSIMLQCGDWGYKRGDLDRNCKVDLSDFAMLADDWLKCTMPDDPECESGSF
jgi:hypothetical protein